MVVSKRYRQSVPQGFLGTTGMNGVKTKSNNKTRDHVKIQYKAVGSIYPVDFTITIYACQEPLVFSYPILFRSFTLIFYMDLQTSYSRLHFMLVDSS